MPETVNGIPIPVDGDPVDLPGDLQAFAEAVPDAAAEAGATAGAEAAVGYASGLDATKMKAVLDGDNAFTTGLSASSADAIAGAAGSGLTPQEATDGRVLEVGNVSFARVLRPSGGDDTAIINAALVVGDLVLTAPTDELATPAYFTTSGAIRIPGDRTLILRNAEVRLAANSNCNIVQNFNQNSTGDASIVVRGEGRAILNGNAVNQVGATAAINTIGVSWAHVTGLKVSDVTIGPCRGPAMVGSGVVRGRINRIDLAQDGSTSNQDGMDFGPSCDDVVVDGVTGKTGDDLFSVFSQTTAGFCHSYYKGVGVATGTKNITLRNVTVNVGINPLRVQAGDGLTLSGVHASNIRNTNTDSASNNYSVIMFGEASYVTTPPASSADINDIMLRGYHGRGNVIVGACSKFSDVVCEDITLTLPWKALIGIPQASSNYASVGANVVLRKIVTLDASTSSTGTCCLVPTGSTLDGLVMHDLRLARFGNIFNNSSSTTVSRVHVDGVVARTMTGQIERSGAVVSGYIDNVVAFTAPSLYWANNAAGLIIGPNMPTLNSADLVPTAARGSVIRCNHTLDPTGGGGTTGGEYVGNGTSWIKRVDLGSSF